eukprot:365096-Chlamydomonas_euryale.AAC.15
MSIAPHLERPLPRRLADPSHAAWQIPPTPPGGSLPRRLADPSHTTRRIHPTPPGRSIARRHLTTPACPLMGCPTYTAPRSTRSCTAGGGRPASASAHACSDAGVAPPSTPQTKWA